MPTNQNGVHVYGVAEELMVLRQALSLVPHLGVMVVDLASQRYVMAAGGLAFTLRYHELVGRRWRETLPPERHGAFMTLLDEARRARRFTTHWVTSQIPRHLLQVVGYGSPADDPTHVVLVSTDKDAAEKELGLRPLPKVEDFVWEPGEEPLSGRGE